MQPNFPDNLTCLNFENSNLMISLNDKNFESFCEQLWLDDSYGLRLETDRKTPPLPRPTLENVIRPKPQTAFKRKKETAFKRKKETAFKTNKLETNKLETNKLETNKPQTAFKTNKPQTAFKTNKPQTAFKTNKLETAFKRNKLESKHKANSLKEIGQLSNKREIYEILEKYFEENNYPNIEQKTLISKELNLPIDQISTWFNQMRLKRRNYFILN